MSYKGIIPEKSNIDQGREIHIFAHSDILLTTAKCAKPRPLKIFATSEQHKELKRLQAKVADLTLILNVRVFDCTISPISDSVLG